MKLVKELAAFVFIVIPIFIGVIYVITKLDNWQKNQPQPRDIVYACPVGNSVKCYELEADISRSCNGPDDPCDYSIDALYFPNGGTISLSTCSPSDDHKLLCVQDDNDNAWKIDVTGRKSATKYPVIK